MLTFFLVWVVFATAVDPRGTFKQIAGLAIGFTITLDILMGGVPDGRGDEPGARLRPAARRRPLVALLGLVRRPVRGRRDRRVALRAAVPAPDAPEPVGPPETGVEESGAGEAAVS